LTDSLVARYLDPDDLPYPTAPPVQHDPNFLTETPVKKLKVENEDKFVTMHEIIDCNEKPYNNNFDDLFSGNNEHANIFSKRKKRSTDNNPEEILYENLIISGEDREQLIISKLVNRIEATLIRSDAENYDFLFKEKINMKEPSKR